MLRRGSDEHVATGDYCYVTRKVVLLVHYAMMIFPAVSGHIWIFVMPSAAFLQDALLRTDLLILLDGNVLVGLEGGHDVVGDLGTI